MAMTPGAATEANHALGMAMAVGTAIIWAASVLLMRRGVKAGAGATNLLKNVIGSLLMVPTLAFVGWDGLTSITGQDLAILACSGVLGIAIGDWLFLGALARLGAGWMALFDCVYAPTVVLAAVFVLGEPLPPEFGLGAGLVVIGLVLATWQTPRDAPVRGGVWLGIGSIVVVALAVVLAKPALGRTGLLAATAVRLWVGLLAQAAVLCAVPQGRAAFRVLISAEAWRTIGPPAVLGTWAAMILWLGGIKYTHASVAAVLNQLAVVFMLLGARFWLGETVSRRRWLGSALAASGAAVIAVA